MKEGLKGTLIGAAGVMAFAFAFAGAASAEVILVPDSSADAILVLDPDTGDLQTTVDISDFASTPIEVIDGPGDTLLISDQVGDMVFQLESDGTLVGNYLTAERENIRGIDLLANGFLVGATADGLAVWNRDGELTSRAVDGNFFDAMSEFPGVLAATEIDVDNAQGFSLSNGSKIGETPPGETNFPEQVARIRTADGNRLAVCTFSDSTLYVYNLNGTLDFSFPLNALGRGVLQLNNGNILISTGDAIDEFTVDGQFVRSVVSGGSYRFFSRSDNFQQ